MKCILFTILILTSSFSFSQSDTVNIQSRIDSADYAWFTLDFELAHAKMRLSYVEAVYKLIALPMPYEFELWRTDLVLCAEDDVREAQSKVDKLQPLVIEAERCLNELKSHKK